MKIEEMSAKIDAWMPSLRHGVCGQCQRHNKPEVTAHTDESVAVEFRCEGCGLLIVILIDFPQVD